MIRSPIISVVNNGPLAEALRILECKFGTTQVKLFNRVQIYLLQLCLQLVEIPMYLISSLVASFYFKLEPS